MLTYHSSAISKIKMLIFIPLIAIALLCCSKTNFSPAKQQCEVRASAFGRTDTAIVKNITYDEMLANPSISFLNADVKVTSFEISCVPDGLDFRGPYLIKGSQKIEGGALEMLRTLKNSGYKRTRVFIENIHIDNNGKDEVTNPVVLVARPG